MFDEFAREVFDGGQQIFKSGDPGDCAYLIEEGMVEILVPKQGEEHRIKLMGKGELFGEVSLIDYQPRTATVKAVERTVLVPIPRKLMEGLLEKCDPVLRHLLLVILERFRNRNDGSVLLSNATYEPEQLRRRSVVQQEATHKLSIAHGMKRALDREEFRLYYQPICNLSDGQVAGFEALIRWQHPVEGQLQPNDFLRIAEQTGLMHEIGSWAVNRACQDWNMLRQFAASYESPFMSVNLSAMQLGNDKLVEEIMSILAKQNMDPAELQLELTETAMIESPDTALVIMRELINRGCRLALDDYGAGHSGLKHLQQYPLDTLKLDSTFVEPLATCSQSLEIVRSSVALAHSLNMNVIAEGIETENVRTKLLEMKCDLGQGWYFGRPATLQELVVRYANS